MLDLVIRGGQVVTPQGVGAWDVGVEGERIVAIAAPGTLPRAAGERAGRSNGDDAFALDADVPGAHTLGRHDLSAADHEIEHGAWPSRVLDERSGFPGARRMCCGFG